MGFVYLKHRRSQFQFSNKYSYLFDGVDEFITIPDSSDFNLGSYTLSAWIKSSSIAAQQRIISQQNEGYWVMGLDAGRLRFCDSFELGCAFTTETVNDGTWHHVAVVRDININDKYKWYIDGLLKKTVTGTNTSIHNNTANVGIGKHIGGSEFFDGNIDELSVWNIGLTAAQISEIYNNGKPKNLLNHSASSNLVSYFRMGDGDTWDGTNWTPIDKKGTNNGTSTNMEFSDNELDVI